MSENDIRSQRGPAACKFSIHVYLNHTCGDVSRDTFILFHLHAKKAYHELEKSRKTNSDKLKTFSEILIEAYFN